MSYNKTHHIWSSCWFKLPWLIFPVCLCRATWWRKATRGRTGRSAGSCWSPAPSPTTSEKTWQKRKETSCWMEAALSRQEPDVFTGFWCLKPKYSEYHLHLILQFNLKDNTVKIRELIITSAQNCDISFIFIHRYTQQLVLFSSIVFWLQPLPDKEGKKCLFFIKSSLKSFEISVSDKKKKQEWIQGE